MVEADGCHEFNELGFIEVAPQARPSVVRDTRPIMQIVHATEQGPVALGPEALAASLTTLGRSLRPLVRWAESWGDRGAR